MVRGSLSARRRRYGYLLAVLGAAALVAVLVPLRGHLDLASDALLFLLLVVTTAIVGGLGPGPAGRRPRVGAAELLLHRAGPHPPDPGRQRRRRGRGLRDRWR